ncbi:GNAT family N-acetyltransferase [Kitasatospora sp. NPDC059599]|uniref:GNAT family N-acetyltransferase n=1 Tax=Kitasatospora sp. NPDC059599 TaxID=3346880 RepID=UPI0036C4BB1E
MHAPVDGLTGWSCPLGDGLTGTVLGSVADLRRTGLTDLPGEPVWAGADWWRFVEADDDHEILYLLINRADTARPIAVAPALLIRGPEQLLFYNGPRIIGDFSAIGHPPAATEHDTARARHLAPQVAEIRPTLYPWLTVGVFGSSLGLRPFDIISPTDTAPLVPALDRLARATAAELGCAGHSLLYLDPAEDAAGRDHAAATGAARALFGAEAVLDVPENGLDGYLARFPSARRSKLRKEMQAYRAAGLHTTAAEGPDALGEQHLALRIALRAKYGHAAGESWARREFAALRDTLGDRLTVLSSVRDGRVVGYLLAFRAGDVLYTRSAGFDYEAVDGTYCYFNLVYYDTVQWAARNGIRRIHYGLGTTEAKHTRGCTLVPRRAYFTLPEAAAGPCTELLAVQDRSARARVAALGLDAS